MAGVEFIVPRQLYEHHGENRSPKYEQNISKNSECKAARYRKVALISSDMRAKSHKASTYDEGSHSRRERPFAFKPSFDIKENEPA